LLDHAEHKRRTVATATDRKKKSLLGQFMTPASVARFMASLFDVPSRGEISLLDAGAGLGALTSAFLERLPPTVKARSEAFEVDAEIAFHLAEVLLPYLNRGVDVVVRVDDYIEAGTDMALRRERPYTHAILNPPYKKIATASWYRQELRRAGLETVNLYSGFVGLAIMALADHGQMVVIMPRSFANGPYYMSFRKLLLDECSIRRMHLFDARNKTFKDDAVLQETIIMHIERGGAQGDVVVSRSTDDSLDDMEAFTLPFSEIVRPDDAERFIHVPSDGAKSSLEQALPEASTLLDLGLKVSTGPVVDFRMRQYLHPMPGARGSIPLLYPQHFKDVRLEGPIEGKKPNAITLNGDTAKWMYPNGWYAVCRRFTAKEERRRVVASHAQVGGGEPWLVLLQPVEGAGELCSEGGDRPGSRHRRHGGLLRMHHCGA
jgi:adenine-specific DNA-methyltransferase